MSVLIKDIDKELYARFKAEAALHGIKLGEALTLAMRSWLQIQKNGNIEDGDRIQNNATYRRLLPSLLEKHQGKWIIIHDSRLVGIFENRETALDETKKLKLTGHSIVCPISDNRQLRSMGLRRREK